MHSCDTAKQREFWLYPMMVCALAATAVLVEARLRRFGRFLALANGFIAVVLMGWIEGMIA